MQKRKKPALKRRRHLLSVSSSRRRIKRTFKLMKLHRHRRNYQTFIQAQSEPSPAV